MPKAWEQQGELLWESEILIEPVHLQPGHFVSRLDRPWIGTPFSLEGVMISDQRQLDWLRQHCDWLVIDLLRSENRFRPPRGRLNERSAHGHWDGYLEDEQAPINVLRQASLDRDTVGDSVQCHDLLYRQATYLIDAMSRSGQIDLAQARIGINQMAETLEHNLAAMVWLTRIKNADQYTAEHCVNVAILAMGLAHALEWKREQVELAGFAGMLHDLGKMQLDKQILNKPGRLSSEEYEHIKKHAQFGFAMLQHDPQIDPRVALAVLEHHERPDGSGYPNGRDRGALQPLSALISVVDAYDAITSQRPYSAPRSHHEALGILWKERGRQFDTNMVESLIQFLGWITPGTLVRLSSDEFAVVLCASHQHRLWPVVRVLAVARQGYRAARRLDLAEHNQHHSDQPLRVAEVLADGALEIDLQKILRQEGDAAETGGGIQS
ncbi:MAG: HD-GYP domain-containing protein [Wenzhouxiangellaceae bacterium]|nr:HD-GYP domain-containing protein [Wenzhouxiangellaceae bacterium]